MAHGVLRAVRPRHDEKLLTYALGRGVAHQDMPLVRSIARDGAPGHRFSALVLAIVKSTPFQMNMKSRQDAGGVSDTSTRSNPEKGAQICPSSPREHSPTDVPAERRRDAGAAAARRDGAGEHGAGADRAPRRRRASSASSFRTAWRPATGSRHRRARCPEKLPYILESLEKVKNQTVVMSGLWSKSAEPPEGTTGPTTGWRPRS